MPRITVGCGPFHRCLACSTYPNGQMFLNWGRFEDGIAEFQPENTALETGLAFPERSYQSNGRVHPFPSVVEVRASMGEIFLVPAHTNSQHESSCAEIVDC